ncbi:Hypothetical predicted protein [Pelobates cultripes]|uniref:Uncharacterized protein n=1 Tax=Pelobates cultripes TaxID=61616 RepID=A0AAD1SQP0_PELCU|nr:Hypothetical predicted protein [Pelobates cultripes]
MATVTAAIHNTAARHHNIRANACPSPLQPSIPLGKRQPPFTIWPLFRAPSNDAPHYVPEYTAMPLVMANHDCNLSSQCHSQYGHRHIRPPTTIWMPPNTSSMPP